MAAVITPPPDPCASYGIIRLVDSLTPVILQQMGESGDNKKSTIGQCQFFPADSVVRLNLVIDWSGTFSSKPYQVTGDLTVTNKSWSFQPGAGNANYNELKGGQKKTVGTLAAIALVGAAIAASSSDNSESGNRAKSSGEPQRAIILSALCLTNRTPTAVYFEWRKARENRWVTDSLRSGRAYRFPLPDFDSLLVRYPPTSTSQPWTYRLPSDIPVPTECGNTGFYLQVDGDTLRIFKQAS